MQNLGEFLASFSQPPIIGLAYSYRLDMFITNAADQEFRQQYQSKMLLYSNQPNSSVIIQNLEHYEREFAKEFLITADASDKKLISIALPIPPISHMTTPSDSTKKVNIESYLLNIINAHSFNDRMNTSTGSGRLSSTTASESDECELFSIQNSSIKQEVKEEAQDQKVAPKAIDVEDPFAKFLKFNTPFKNNFLNNRVLTPTSNESHTFVWNMTMKILNNGSQEKDSGMYTIEDFENVYKEFRNNDEDEDLDEEDYITDYNNMGGNSMSGAHIKLGGAPPSVQLYDNLSTGESSTDDGMGYGRRNLSNVTVGKRGADALNNNDNLDDDLPPPPPITEETESFQKILDNLTLRDKMNNNEEDLEQYNSHQYWRIEPTCEIILERNNNQLPEEFDISSASTVEDTSTFNHDADDVDSTDSMKVNYNKNQVIYNKLQAFNETDGAETTAARNDNLEVEWNLIEDFVYMKDIDNNLSYKCAYSFPAVLLTLGKKWVDSNLII